MRTTLALVAMALLSTGCHAKFKKHAPTIDEVRPQALQLSVPHVQLGYMAPTGDSAVEQLVAIGVNVAQTAKSIELSRKLAGQVDTEQVNQAFLQGLQESLGDGPPFTTTTNKDAPVLQIEIVSMGMDVPAIGVPGMFTYDLRIRLYKPDGERVYSNTVSCATGVGSPDPLAAALLVVNNAKQLESMPPQQIQAAFDGSAYYCGMELTRQIRKHAG